MVQAKKKVSIITGVFNEELNVRACYEEVKRVLTELSDQYTYEHIFGDNCSQDRTLEILREIAANDPNVKVLTYSRNFGGEKSSLVMLQHTTGDVCIGIPCDMQEPPSIFPTMLAKWREGYDLVCGIYKNRSDGFVMRKVRKLYYWLIDKIAEDDLDRDFAGFAAYDRKVLNVICGIDDYNPYIRGVASTIGFKKAYVYYDRVPRLRGKSKHRFASLFSYAVNALISHSILPIRLATFTGLLLSCLSLLAAVTYAIVKLFLWNIQAPGATSTIVLILFFSGIQLFFLGVLGEYVGAIHGQVRRKPFVIITEKINFDPSP